MINKFSASLCPCDLIRVPCYQLKEFILNEPEAYEMKIGDQVFRRPGDPPLDEVIERLKTEKTKADDGGPPETDAHIKEDL